MVHAATSTTGAQSSALAATGASKGSGSTGTDARASVTSLLSALPRADLTSLFSHLPVAVPNLASVLANPAWIVGGLPLPDLQWLLSNLPVAAPSVLAGALANPPRLLSNPPPTPTGLRRSPHPL